MSRKGNCLDDAVIEGFLGTLKAEYFYLATIEDVEALQAGVNDYIDYDNSERVKLGLKEFSPVK